MSTAPTLITTALLLALATLPACLPVEEELMTEPCLENCNTEAALGSPCEKAEDCALNNACNLGFPSGYCQGTCIEGAVVGAACNEDAGQCVLNAEGGLACLKGCSEADPTTCARPDLTCYPVGGTEASVCHLLCGSDDVCGQGVACDGAGVCRPAGATCDGLTQAGCPTGQNCYFSPVDGAFCGSPGVGQIGQACNRVAGCVTGHWCVENTCRKLCAVDDRLACGSIPSLCRAVVQGFRLGYCRL